MKVFVGTLECGEGDFDECMRMIGAQKDVDVTHMVISNLPEKDAHERLYTQWNIVKPSYDLFLKVDADTVLAHDGVIKAYVDMFEANDRLTGVQAWLFDHMTLDNIYGLTCVRNNVTIATQVDDLYCDKVDSGHDVVLRGAQLPKELVPAGYHCKHSTEVQAFHYGFHRGKKNQREIRIRLLNAWSQHKDRIRGMALLGFSMALAANVTSYDTPEFQKLYNNASLNYDELIKNVTK